MEISRLKHFPFEAIIWIGSLVALGFTSIHHDHFTICPFALIGFEWCPGCGLGRSISLFFHGEILDSLKVHPVGIFAVIVLSFRIISLIKQYIKNYGKSY